jgi:DNA-binding FadR family transcriptional regulator
MGRDKLARIGLTTLPDAAMPLQAVDNRRLYRQIADQIAALIENGEYGAGQRLPPERDLAKQLGVSRPSVREALIALEVEGYVEVRVGSGVYVLGPRTDEAHAQLPADSGPFELIRARWLIEAECAALAAKAATKAQVRSMEDALDQMEAERQRGVMPLGADRLFHLRIAEASGNSALALVVKTLWDQRTGPLFLRLEHHFDTPDLWSLAIREHREIVQAIARHDAIAARGAMRRHMNHAAKRFSTSWDKRKRIK